MVNKFRITDDKVRSELLQLAYDMQEALVRAFCFRPTSGDIGYMQTKTKAVIHKVATAVMFAKKYNMPELVASLDLEYTLLHADALLRLTPKEARYQNKAVKPKVYEIFVRMLEDFASYTRHLVYLAMGEESHVSEFQAKLFDELCERFWFEIAEHELFEAHHRKEIDYETLRAKTEELYKKKYPQEEGQAQKQVVVQGE